MCACVYVRMCVCVSLNLSANKVCDCLGTNEKDILEKKSKRHDMQVGEKMRLQVVWSVQ